MYLSGGLDLFRGRDNFGGISPPVVIIGNIQLVVSILILIRLVAAVMWPLASVLQQLASVRTVLLCLSVVILLFFFSLIYFCYGVYAFTAFTLSLGGRKGMQPVQKLSGGVLAWFCLE